MTKKFATLRLLSTILKIIAWIVAATTIIVFFMVLFGGVVAGRMGSGALFGILLVGFEFFIVLYAGAEIISILLAIERNTRRSE